MLTTAVVEVVDFADEVSIVALVPPSSMLEMLAAIPVTVFVLLLELLFK